MAIAALRQFLENDSEGFRRLENIISESQCAKTYLPSLSLDEIERLFEDKRSFDTSEEIFAEGDKGDGVYLIQTKSDLAYRFMSCVCLPMFRHILRMSTLYSKVKKEF